MKEVILLLYLKDEKYGKRLLRYLSGKKNPLLHPELVTLKERIDMRTASESEELAVLTDYAGVQENNGRKVIYLSAEADKSQKKILKYQKAAGIYKAVLELLELNPVPEVRAVKEPEGRSGGIFCLLDPEGTGAAALAVLLSQYLGKQGKCLYLNLTGFPLYYGEKLQEKPDFSAKGLGELLFCMDREELAERMERLVKPFGSAQMLAPFPHFKDLLDCGAGEWRGLLQRLQAECGYDSIVMEAGQLFEYTLDLMEQSDYAYLLESSGICGRIRTEVFWQYCRLEQKEGLIAACHVARPPLSREEGMEILCRLSPEEMGEDAALMQRIQDWLEGECMRKEEEDDCIIESDG
jgi:hypothetical protein